MKTINNLNFSYYDYLFPILSSTIGLFIILFSQLTFANFFGTSLEADNYSWVIGTITILFGLSHNSFKSSITPIFLANNTNNQYFFSLTFYFYLYYFIIQSILVFFIYNNIDLVLNHLTKFDKSRIPDLKELFIFFLPFIYLKGFTTINYAILASLSKYKFQFFIEKILNPLIFLFSILYLYKKLGVISAVIGLNFSALLLFFGSFIFVIKKIGIKIIYLNSASIFIEFLKFDLIYKITYLVSILAELISKYILSGLKVGATAYINYADKILKVTDVSFNTSISPVLLTDLSKSINDDIKNINKLFEYIFQLLSFIIIPITFFIFFSSEQIIKILYYRGEFDLESVNYTKNALQLMIFSTISVTLLVLNNKIYASLKDSKTGLLISVPSYCIFGLNYYFLGSHYGFLGIALAITINSFISLIISSYFIHKKHFKYDFKKLVKMFLKYSIISIFNGLTANYFTIVLIGDLETIFNSLSYLLLYFLIFLISYILSLYIIKDQLAKNILILLKK